MIRRGALCACLCLLSAARMAGAAGPDVVAVSPGAGAGPGRTFTFIYSDAEGASDIAATEAVIVSGTDLTGVNACFIHASGNQFWLRDDANLAWQGPVAAGSKTIYMNGTDRSGLSSLWLAAGTWRVTPLNPGLDVISSSCADASKDAHYSIQIVDEQAGRVSRMVFLPSCFPSHAFYSPQEGMFLGRRPLPVMGRTSGHFDVLFVFVDTDVNRRELLDNASFSESVKAKVSAGRVREALEEALTSYTPAAVMSGLRLEAASAVDFTFSVEVSRLPHAELELRDGGLGFARHDAVVLLDDLVTVSGIGVRRWPWQRHLFHGKDGGDAWPLRQRAAAPKRPDAAERVPHRTAHARERGQHHLRSHAHRQPPDGRKHRAARQGVCGQDGDGITDCIDPFLTPTADNVDSDFIPDRFDPDLQFDHRPYSWMYVESHTPGSPR